MTTGSPSPAIDCRHVTHRYGDVIAVDDLTLSVHHGETMGLLGPNGAGKTTLVRVLTTLTPVQHGHVDIFGLDTRRDTMDIRHNLGYVPQQLSIEAALTGRQNVELFARLYDVPRRQRSERVDEALSAVHLLDVADKPAKTYSGGMVRRLELAQALVNRPSLLILDEPTVGLDPIARDSVWTQVSRMQHEFGMTVLLTTHYMEEADALCDRLAIIDHGSVVTEGTPLELKRQIAGDIVAIGITGDAQRARQLLADKTFVREVEVGEPEVETGLVRLRLFVDDGSAAVPDILRTLDAADIAPSSIELHRHSLDDVFLKQTGRSLREND